MHLRRWYATVHTEQLAQHNFAALTAASGHIQLFQHSQQEKGKVYTIRRHDGSLCTQKQPETAFTAYTMTAAGEVPEAQLTKLLDPHVDRRTKQHIEVLRCLGLVESVVTPENGASPVPLAPTVASRLAHTHTHTHCLASPTSLQCTGVSIARRHSVCTAQTYMQRRCTAALLWLCRE